MPQLAPYIELHAYAELQQEQGQPAAGQQVVFLDFPELALQELVQGLREQGVHNLYLLYKQQEEAVLRAQLPLLYPEREGMTKAYKLVMEGLQQQPALALTPFLEKHKQVLSENALKIMLELGFVSLNNGIIKRNIIKRCQLEDSPLYVALQQKRQALENIYKENLRLSQYDLLRG